MRSLNLEILPPVDAARSSLTEFPLCSCAAGFIDQFGSVDADTYKTKPLAPGQQPGLAMRSAAVSLETGMMVPKSRAAQVDAVTDSCPPLHISRRV